MRAVKLAFLTALLFAAPVGPATAQVPGADAAARPPAAAPAETGRILTRSGDYPQLAGQGSEMAFVAGGQVRISAQIADDIFAAGRRLRVDGASADHLFLAGGEIDLAPATVRDVIAAGGRIQLRSGAVSDDLVAAGGDVSLDRSARIGGSAVLAGGRLRIEAPVGGELRASAGRIELSGPVAGDARLQGDEILIGPEARVGGDLHVRGARIEIAPGAVVQGRTLREVVKRDGEAAAKLGVAAVAFALGVLIMFGVVAAVAPRLMAGVDRRLRSRPGTTLAIGAALLLLGPVAIVALMATLIGAPLALLLTLVYLLATPLAFAGVAYWIGQFFRGRLARARAAEPPGWIARFGWTVLAALLLMMACMIPLIGWLIWLLTIAGGMGALAGSLFLREAAPAAAPPPS